MALPPAQPAYILRGHAAQIHSATFIRGNTRLVTGDAEGWVVIWSIATKRAVAVWRAHEGSILGSAEWGPTLIITHGKDNKLVVWKLAEEDESSMSIALPVDDANLHRKPPWLVHILHVNTLNFCSFAYCTVQGSPVPTDSVDLAKANCLPDLLVVVPNTIISEDVDIFHLPSERRIHTVSGDKAVNIGMVMAVRIFYVAENLTVITGFESGHTRVSQQVDGQNWHVLYMSQPHSQPVLSLDVSPDYSSYLTSSADAIIAKHPIPSLPQAEPASSSTSLSSLQKISQSSGAGVSLLSKALASANPAEKRSMNSRVIEVQTTPLKIVQTKHSGQQGLHMRSDGRIFATAGWDSKARVYSARTLKELAVLKWHKEGCYAVAFAEILSGGSEAGSGGREFEGSITNESDDGRLDTANKKAAIQQRRILKATLIHWLAAGSKDGKVAHDILDVWDSWHSLTCRP